MDSDVHKTQKENQSDTKPLTATEHLGSSNNNSATKTEAELVSDQFAELITVESTLQEKHLNDEIESMLLKITEFMEVVEMIRSDTNICVISNLPLVTEKSEKLQETFDRIDSLEIFVNHVSKTLKELEAQAEVAEAHFSSFASIKKKLFGALSNIGRKHQDTSLQHQTTPTEPRQAFEAVDIFSTEEFFPVPEAND
ncbi:biogenesis of lysosome-related organelles complex 1 subunit 4-like [Watersipora subatra]|uniref:biogenesis of lysosome-related organelles complex 1 subunit 4-like n=1 Tax=Watersipora subatra TaxID=2589382 RepID=UPI00355C8A7C